MHRPEPNFNVATQVIKQAEQNPGNTAIIFEGKTTSYGEFATRVRKQAGLLRGRGVCVGDRVGFLGFNQPGFIETMFATISLGAVFVPLNFRLTGEELAFIIGDAGVHTLVVDPELTGVIDSVRDRLPCHHYFAVEGTLPG
ncbi:MAG: AMP-binding protein, partial [Pseudomonadota bacterium]|nr:AMP-binding protein [Pseudomonadota bacterium]